MWRIKCCKDINIVERVISIKDKIKMSQIHSSVRDPEGWRKKTEKRNIWWDNYWQFSKTD